MKVLQPLPVCCGKSGEVQIHEDNLFDHHHRVMSHGVSDIALQGEGASSDLDDLHPHLEDIPCSGRTDEVDLRHALGHDVGAPGHRDCVDRGLFIDPLEENSPEEAPVRVQIFRLHPFPGQLLHGRKQIPWAPDSSTIHAVAAIGYKKCANAGPLVPSNARLVSDRAKRPSASLLHHGVTEPDCGDQGHANPLRRRGQRDLKLRAERADSKGNGESNQFFHGREQETVSIFTSKRSRENSPWRQRRRDGRPLSPTPRASLPGS